MSKRAIDVAVEYPVNGVSKGTLKRIKLVVEQVTATVELAERRDEYIPNQIASSARVSVVHLRSTLWRSVLRMLSSCAGVFLRRLAPDRACSKLARAARAHRRRLRRAGSCWPCVPQSEILTPRLRNTGKVYGTSSTMTLRPWSSRSAQSGRRRTNPGQSGVSPSSARPDEMLIDTVVTGRGPRVKCGKYRASQRLRCRKLTRKTPPP